MFCPKKHVVNKLIRLTSDIQSIFDYEFKGRNCLFAATNMMEQYFKLNRGLLPKPTIDMFKSSESLIIDLILTAERNEVDVGRFINCADQTGFSFFQQATMLSETVTIELINRNVKVNRIDKKFTTPHFNVRQPS